MIVRSVQNRTREQTAYLEQLIQSDETIALAFNLHRTLVAFCESTRGRHVWSSGKPQSGPAGLQN